jgi:hypothetical protein
MKIKTGRSHCYIIGAYAPVEGKAEETGTFYKQLQESLNTAGRKESYNSCRRTECQDWDYGNTKINRTPWRKNNKY